MSELFADLVLEGGGVKGIGLVGAYSVLEDRGYTIKRVAGTSAGSIVGAMIAAGYTAAELEREIRALDYTRFQDPAPIGEVLSVLFESGMYKGQFAHDWIREKLAAHHVHTFADLPYQDADFPLPPEQAYRLVVMAADVTHGQLRRLPWHNQRYRFGVGQPLVADAVRASMSIPFFFRPVKWHDLETGRICILVDGGMLSNFPIEVFDAEGREPRWPTIGIKLSTKQLCQDTVETAVHGPLSLAQAMIRTMSEFHDRIHINSPAVQDRTIFVDTTGIRSTDFHLGPEACERLFQAGRTAALKFLDGDDGQPPWDWELYKKRYRAV